MVCDIQSLLDFSRCGCSMHYEEEKLEIQSNGQCIVKKKGWKYKVMDKKVDKWEEGGSEGVGRRWGAHVGLCWMSNQN